MEYCICLITIFTAIVLLKIVFNINFKEAKKFEENSNEFAEISNKFPENIDVAKTILKQLNNENVEIEQQKDTKTSLYIALTNKITIADMKSHYGRIQTIAHECVHSIQDRRLLLFNFFYSNFFLLYFTIISILTIFKVINNGMLQLFILLLIGFIQFIIRGYLETDAMTKAKYVAKEYMEQEQKCSKEEINKLVNQYEKINKIGIPMVLYVLICNILAKIGIYSIILIILNFI